MHTIRHYASYEVILQLVTNLVEIGPEVFEKNILLNLVDVFSVFRNYLPLEKGEAIRLNKPESTSPEDALCEVWLK